MPNATKGWVIPFTDDELTAIYNCIEKVQTLDDAMLDAALDSVIDKIVPQGMSNPRPAGAIDRA